MSGKEDKVRRAEAKLAGLRRVYGAIRRGYAAARDEGAAEGELEAIEETGKEVSARIQRGEEYMEGWSSEGKGEG